MVDGEGHSSHYTANDKKEKHQLAGGTIETRTKWNNGELHQEISLGGDMKIRPAQDPFRRLEIPRCLVEAWISGKRTPKMLCGLIDPAGRRECDAQIVLCL